MKCTACGYEHDNTKPGEYSVETTLGNGGTMKTTYKNRGKPFIEIIGCFMKYNFNAAGDITGSECADLYACPNCGTVRMDNGC